MQSIAWSIHHKSEFYMEFDKYELHDVSWVFDPPNKDALVKLSLFDKIKLWLFFALLNVRDWLRLNVRYRW